MSRCVRITVMYWCILCVKVQSVMEVVCCMSVYAKWPYLAVIAHSAAVLKATRSCLQTEVHSIVRK
jgi:hypothetical protein